MTAAVSPDCSMNDEHGQPCPLDANYVEEVDAFVCARHTAALLLRHPRYLRSEQQRIEERERAFRVLADGAA